MRIALSRTVLPLFLLFSSIAVADARPEAVAAAPKFESELGKVERTLSEVSSSLEHQLQRDDAKAAEALFHLEQQTISLIQAAESGEIALHGLSHEQTVGSLRAMLQRVLRYEERVRDHAQVTLDRVLPGEPERRLVIKNGLSVSSNKRVLLDGYRPLYRQGTPKPGEAPKSDADRLDEMRGDFLAKGGVVNRDIKRLGVRYLDGLPSGQLAEWTQLNRDDITITTQGAKHPVIGGGKAVRGAGSMKVYRDAKGEIAVAVVSNSSGNYKPGVGSVEGLVQKLVDLGVPPDRIVTTSIVPGEPEILKLLLKAKGYSKDVINARAELLRAPYKVPRTTAKLAPTPKAPVVARRAR